MNDRAGQVGAPPQTPRGPGSLGPHKLSQGLQRPRRHANACCARRWGPGAKPLAFVFAALTAASMWCGPAAAHGDHGSAPPGAVVIAPRTEARSGPVEIVAEVSGGTLAVFLSRFSDGVPITGARVEASTDLQSAPLAESDAGVYVTKDILFADGRNDMSVTFTAAGAAARTQA